MALTNAEKQKRFRARRDKRMSLLKHYEKFFNAHCMLVTWDAEVKLQTKIIVRLLNEIKEN